MYLSPYRIVVILLLISLSYSSNTFSQEKYVTDILRITLRTGPSNDNKIIKTLHSGAKLEVLEESDTGYTMVRLEDQTEGWVRTQYLQDEPVARSLIVNATSDVQLLKQELDKLKIKANTLSTKNNELEKERNGLQNSKTDLEKENRHFSKIASRPIELDNDNKKLKKLNVTLEHNLQRLTQENQILKDQDSRTWFIAGAAVLLFGMLIGIIIPKIKMKKRSSWDF
ncbi:MAG: TIGR04211 family SH3 domain-containing protein [Gammaproteobacteria bacterium]